MNHFSQESGKPWLWALICLTLAGCASTAAIPRDLIPSPDGPDVEMALERMDAGLDGITTGSAAADGSVWLLAAERKQVLARTAAARSWLPVPLVDENGRTLLDPVSIDATGGLSLLVGDRSLGRIYRVDRSGVLLGAYFIPDPGPGIDHVALSDSPGTSWGLSDLVSLSGDRLAALDGSARRLALVDEGAGEIRFLDLPFEAAAMAAGQGSLVLADRHGATLQFVGPYGVAERTVELPADVGAMEVVDMVLDGRDLFVLSADGLLLHVRETGTDSESLHRLRATPSVTGTWLGLVVLPDALWWIGTDGVFRSVRPRS